MDCHDAATLLAAHADREVGGFGRYSLQKHLRACAACAAKHEQALTLRARLRAEVPYFKAPSDLHARLRARFADPPAAARPRPQAKADRRHWLSAGALAGCAATVLAWVVTNALVDWRVSEDLAVEAVAIHTRAVVRDHLIQVASSDRHTVKPWLSARLDYSPPVQDLASEGFALTGGRLDTLRKRTVATLVYRYRQHVIDVFVQPDSMNPIGASPQLRTVRGFNVAHASGSGMDWLAVSDVSPDVLTAFVRRLADAGPASTPLPQE